MSEKVNSVAELLQEAVLASEYVIDRWGYAVFTDRLILEKWGREKNLVESILKSEGRLLELRLFWRDAEYKAFRGNIGGRFRFRVKNDDSTEDYFDEQQFLDGNMGKLHVRNYISYYKDSGQAYVSDWRMMALEAGENGRK